MANTFTQLNVQIVFAVKGRENILKKSLRPQLFKYMSGILKNCGQFSLAVNGYQDHVHLFFELNPNNSISEIVRIVKSNSSKWLNDNKLLPGKFQWQEGYGAFAYQRDKRNEIIQYIMNQEDHHRKTTFREEYLEILRIFEIDYDERYLFEFYD